MSKLFKDKRSKDYRQFKKWIQALRSGEYNQTTRKLQDINGFCCLGVACKALIPEKQQRIHPIFSRYLYGHAPVHQHNSPQWLKDVNKDFINMTGEFLTTLNDDERLTFDEIADCLEAVYIHEVLG